MKNPHFFYLIIIFILAGFLRFYGINWDQGHHLHPDERAIVMFTIPLRLPSSFAEFFSPSSPLNPHFFAYGNFPLYLLKGTAAVLSVFDKSFDSYDKINLLGRAISVLADIGTLILIFLLAKKLFNQIVSLLAAFFYAVSVFPIQAAHFYAVDTLLTLFIILTLYQLVRFYEKPSVPNSILVGVFFGLSLATKISAIPLIIAIGAAITIDFLLLFIKQPHKPRIWFPHVPRFAKRLIFDGATIAVATIITFAILQPYALLDLKEFLRQTQEQSRMTQDAFTFPYTLQYVGKIPYWHELKNIFLWGQGPILATLSFLGALYITSLLVHIHLRGVPQAQHHLGGVKRSHLRGGRMDSSKVNVKWAQELILLTFFWLYFLIVGKFAVGWMRYMLPLYPLFAIFAASMTWRIYQSLNKKINKTQFIILNSLFIILLLVWPISFMHIYTKSNTRVLASQWIYKNIPPDKTISREHWDDGMPIGGNISYKTLELPIYEMQNPIREAEIYQTIQEADYIIIASNRLYTPLQRISRNCQKWKVPLERCPHNANRYYEKLFNGKLWYKKVAEFAVYPKLEIRNLKLEIDDSSADESFTVYDHPKVMIFKKIK